MTQAAFQEALRTPRLDNAPRRHRIELPAPLDAATSAQFDALGIIQSFQSAVAPAVAAAAGLEGAAAAASSASPADAPGVSASTVLASASTASSTSAPPAAVPVTAALASDAPVAQAAALAPGAAAPLALAMAATRLAPVSARAIFRSDWPARPLDPRITLAAAIVEEPATADDATRPAASDTASGTATATTAKQRAAWLAGAIDAYTARAAYATFDETRKGTLAKDMLADFVIFTTDLFDPKSTTAITDTTITTTVGNGRLVYTINETKPTLSTAP